MIINMNVGGTERALLNMIAEMPEEKYSITILMLEKHGGFLEQIPTNVHKKYLDGYNNMKDILNKPPRKIVYDYVKKGSIIEGLTLFSIFLMAKVLRNKNILFQYLLKNTPDLKDEYDTAIAYAGPMDFISYFVLHKINAKRKIQWIHFDVMKIGFNRMFADKNYHYFDQIYVVSKEGQSKLVENLPHLSDKIEVFLNYVSPRKLFALAHSGTGFTDQFDGLRILTVGRLCKEKGQDLVIPVMEQLKRSGLNVRWYCIGDGSAKETYEKLIREYDVENDFILLGSKVNPYPYMKQCDIYVQPSRHEGYCITLAEAICFNKPILCTDFTGANEQIKDGETGMVVNFNAQEMVEALDKMIKDVQLRKKFIRNLQHNTNNRQVTEMKNII